MERGRPDYSPCSRNARSQGVNQATLREGWKNLQAYLLHASSPTAQRRIVSAIDVSRKKKW